MGITINNIEYNSSFDNDTTELLVGNVGDWQTCKIDFTANRQYRPVIHSEFQYDSPDQFTLLNGKKWTDYGFRDNLDINVTADYYNTDDDSLQFQDYDRFIESIDGDKMIMQAVPLFGRGAKNLPGSWNNEGQAINTTNILFTAKDGSTLNPSNPFITCEIQYCKQINSDQDNDSPTSFIDGTVPTFSVQLSNVIDQVQELELTSTPSGSAVKKAWIKLTSEAEDEFNYSVLFLYNISAFGEEFNFDGSTQDEPEYFFDTETLMDALNIKMYVDEVDRDIRVEQSAKTKKGRVGYFDERFNQFPTQYRVSDVKYFDALGLATVSLAYNAISTVEFKITNISNLSNNTKFQFGLVEIPSSYESNNQNVLKNYNLTTGKYFDYDSTDPFNESLQSYIIGSYAETIEGENGLNIEHIQIDQYGSSGVTVRIRFSPTAEYVERISQATDTNFCLFASVGTNTSMKTAGRATLKVDFQPFEEYENIIGAFPNYQIQMYPYGLETSEGFETQMLSRTEDSYMMRSIFQTGTQARIENVEVRIEAVIGNLEYTLDSYLFDFTNLDYDPVNGYNAYFLSDSPITGLEDGKDEIRLSREPYYDIIDIIPLLNKFGYVIDFPFRLRWEYWQSRNNVPLNWTFPTEPNNGQNNNWYQYLQANNCELYYSVYFRFEGEQVYRNPTKINLLDYDESDTETTIELIRTSDSQSLYLGEDSEGNSENMILTNTEIQVKVTHTNTSGLALADFNHRIMIERFEQNGQFENIDIIDTLTETQIDPNTLEFTGIINDSYIQPEFNYKVSARLIPDWTGTVQNGNPFTTEMDDEFGINFGFQIGG